MFLTRMQRKAVELPPSYEEPPSYTAAIALAQVFFFCNHLVNIIIGPAALLLPATHVAVPLLQHPHHDGAHLRLQGPDVFSC